MKNKIYLLIVLVMVLFAFITTAGGKPVDLPDQANFNGEKNNKPEFLFSFFQEKAFQMYQKNGWVPYGINEILSNMGR